jgi:hypothetical protein
VNTPVEYAAHIPLRITGTPYIDRNIGRIIVPGIIYRDVMQYRRLGIISRSQDNFVSQDIIFSLEIMVGIGGGFFPCCPVIIAQIYVKRLIE